eukprot:8289-Heterococcus_DN1.PRE.2
MCRLPERWRCGADTAPLWQCFTARASSIMIDIVQQAAASSRAVDGGIACRTHAMRSDVFLHRSPCSTTIQ